MIKLNGKGKVGISLAAVVALTLLGITPSVATAANVQRSIRHAKAPLVIGFTTAESGAFASYDEPAVDGARLAIEAINSAGGVDGRMIRYVQANTDTTLGGALTAATSVISQGAQFIMTTCDFDYSAPSVVVAQKHDIVAMASCAGANKYHPQTYGPLAFSMAVATPEEGASMAEFAYQRLHARTAYAVIDQSIDQTKEDAAAFESRWKGLGGKLLGSEPMQQSDTSFSAEVTAISQLPEKPAVIFVSSYPPGGAALIRQIRAAGIKSVILGDSNWGGNYWISSIPGLSNFYNDDFVSIYGNDPSPLVNQVLKEYTRQFHQTPASGIGFSTGYSVVQAFARAYKIAGTTEGKALTRALETFRNVPLMVGSTTFTKTNHITERRPLRIFEVVKGKVRYISEWTPKVVPNV